MSSQLESAVISRGFTPRTIKIKGLQSLRAGNFSRAPRSISRPHLPIGIMSDYERYTMHPDAITKTTTDIDNTTMLLDLEHSACREALLSILPLHCPLSSSLKRNLTTRAIKGGPFDGQPRCTCIVHGADQVQCVLNGIFCDKKVF